MGKASELYRSSASARLLLDLGLLRLHAASRNADGRPDPFALQRLSDPEAAARAEELAALSLDALEGRMGHFETGDRLPPEYARPPRRLSPWEINRGGEELARERKELEERARERCKALCGGKSLAAAAMLAAEEASRAGIRDEDVERVLGLGREALEEQGCGRDLLERIEGDEELALALHRARFAGAKSLEASMAAAGPALSELWRIARGVGRAYRGSGLPLERIFGEGDDRGRIDFGGPGREEIVGSDRTAIFAALLGALSARERSGMAREAILEMTSTGGAREKAWSKIGEWGDLPMAPKEHKANGLGIVMDTHGQSAQRREAGSKARWEDLKAQTSRLAGALGWRTAKSAVAQMLSELSGKPKALGEKTISALAEEARSNEEGAREALALALSLASRKKGNEERLEILDALAARVAEGFSAARGKEGGFSDEALLPGLPEQRGAWLAGEAERIGAEAAAMVAAAAARRFGLEGDGLGLVGEAKGILASQAGLSAGGWRLIAGSESLARAFAGRILDEGELARGRSSEAADGTRGRALRGVEMIIQEADKRGDAFAKRLTALAREDSAIAPALGAGKALSAAAMGGASAEAAERLLALLEKSPSASALLAGMLPRLPENGLGKLRHGTWSGPGRVADALGAEMGQMIEGARRDMADLAERAPALAKGMWERVERARARSVKEGRGEEAALEEAIAEVSGRLGDILEAYEKIGSGFWGGLGKKDPFGDALREHDEWARRERERQAKANPELAKSWEALLGKGKSGKVEIRELETGLALSEEGTRMSHCVGSYSGRCRSGQSRIFSLRLDGTGGATLELAPFGAGGLGLGNVDFGDDKERAKVKEWRIVQNRGKHNAQVRDADLLAASREVARLATEAFLARTRELAEIRRAEEKEAKEAGKDIGEALGQRRAGGAGKSKGAPKAAG